MPKRQIPPALAQKLLGTALEVLDPLDQWSFQCHAASIQLMRSGRFGECRVARGSCVGVGGQHSWLVLGNDCYNEHAFIVDGTLWSYDKSIEGVWVGSYQNERHWPHGKGSIWNWGRPDPAQPGQEMTLTPRKPFSPAAQGFLDLLGPLDREGWKMLAHAPVGGWPAGEIIDAICESGLEECVPIDIRGMVTDRNPSGLYLPMEKSL